MIASLVEVWSHRERMAKSPEQVPGLLWMRWRIVGIYPYEVEDNQLGFQLKALGRVWRFRWGLSCHCFLHWLTKPISNHLTCLLLPTFTFRTAFFLRLTDTGSVDYVINSCSPYSHESLARKLSISSRCSLLHSCQDGYEWSRCSETD